MWNSLSRNWCQYPRKGVQEECHSYYHIFQSLVLNIDLYWALLRVYELCLIFRLRFQSPWSWKSLLYETPVASIISAYVWPPSDRPTTLQASDMVKLFRWDIALIGTKQLLNVDRSFTLCLLVSWKPNVMRCR